VLEWGFVLGKKYWFLLQTGQAFLSMRDQMISYHL
jgi:hypothetical protein